MKRFRELMASVEGRTFKDESGVNAFLDRERITDVELRIAFKHELMAQGQVTDQAPGVALATNRPVSYQPEGPPVSREMSPWLSTAGLTLDKTYSLRDVDEALAASGLGLVERMGLKAEMFDKKRISGVGAGVTSTPRPMSARREMSASTPRQVLRNPDGTARTLTFLP